MKFKNEVNLKNILILEEVLKNWNPIDDIKHQGNLHFPYDHYGELCNLMVISDSGTIPMNYPISEYVFNLKDNDTVTFDDNNFIKKLIENNFKFKNVIRGYNCRDCYLLEYDGLYIAFQRENKLSTTDNEGIVKVDVTGKFNDNQTIFSTLNIFLTKKTNYIKFLNLINIIDSLSVIVREETKESENMSVQILRSTYDGLTTFTKNIFKSEYVINDYDLLYGNGFYEKFIKLVETLKSSKKGLTIFHGLPGTGKTFLIRNLLSIMNKHKEIIYVPSSSIPSLTEPGFMNFILNYIEEHDTKKNILLVIEDAEDIVQDRKENHNQNSVSNLLNSTDGILNDFLNIQVLVTFNTELRNIDQALLRNGRLLGRFEFGYLKPEQIQRICENFKIENKFQNRKCVLSDIFNENTKQERVVFEKEINQDNIL